MSDPRIRGTNGWLGWLLLGGGVLLFLNNMGVLPRLVKESALILLAVVWGLVRIVRVHAHPKAVVYRSLEMFWLVMLAAAVSSHSFGHIFARAMWPLLIISAGALMLVGARDSKFMKPASIDLTMFKIPDGVTDYTILGTVNRRVETDKFEGGKALAVLGTIEVDLRRARVVEFGQSVEYQIDAYLGAVKLRVPESWRVEIRAASVLGTFEDKTIPLGAQPPAATLILSGHSFMSSVEIEG